MTTASGGGGLTVDSIRDCLEGMVPASIATCAPDGTPNVSILSQVHYVDSAHVALSYQFFSKTRENILVNPRATLQVIHPWTAAQYRLSLDYLHTETSGALFESMKAKLSGIASHAGMLGVFRLMGADVYRARSIEAVPGTVLPPQAGRRSLLSATRRCCERLLAGGDLSDLLERLLGALKDLFGVEHALVLMLDETAGRLYTVAAMGYRVSGVGSEVALGDGVIGVAARERTPIRISHMTSEYTYSRAAGGSAAHTGVVWPAATEIPFPGLAEPHSQLAVPILAGARLVGVLFVESPRELRFTYDDEDALAVVAAQFGAVAHALQPPAAGTAVEAAAAGTPAGGSAALIRHYACDDSVFVDNDYLIKGVAGAIFWKLARDFVEHGRTEFSNRELRLAPDIRLPDFAENLEARLILLQRRLAERSSFLRLEKTGRGRFRLAAERPLALEEVA